MTPFWAGGSASRLLNCPWVLGWRTNLARSDRAENTVNWLVCFVAEMSAVCGLFVSWNQQEGTVMCRSHSDGSGERPWVVFTSVCGLELFLVLSGSVRDTWEQKHLKWQEAWEESGALGGLDILSELYMFLNFTVILSLLPPLLSRSTSILCLRVSGQAAWWDDVALA